LFGARQSPKKFFIVVVCREEKGIFRIGFYGSLNKMEALRVFIWQDYKIEGGWLLALWRRAKFLILMNGGELKSFQGLFSISFVFLLVLLLFHWKTKWRRLEIVSMFESS